MSQCVYDLTCPTTDTRTYFTNSLINSPPPGKSIYSNTCWGGSAKLATNALATRYILEIFQCDADILICHTERTEIMLCKWEGIYMCVRVYMWKVGVIKLSRGIYCPHQSISGIHKWVRGICITFSIKINKILSVNEWLVFMGIYHVNKNTLIEISNRM